jgi:acyl carrier protein
MDIPNVVCLTIARELEIPVEHVTAESDSSNLEKWDSLGQLQIIMALERKFNIKFRTFEISELRSVRTLCARIEQLRSQQSGYADR